MTEATLFLPGLSPVGGKTITATFDGGKLSSNGGVLILREIERKLGLAAVLSRHIPDDRDRMRITHSYSDMTRARMFAIASGHEDCDDLDVLRSDPALKMACGRLPVSGTDLMSQPTLSRLENAPFWRPRLAIPRGYRAGRRRSAGGRFCDPGCGHIAPADNGGLRSKTSSRRRAPARHPRDDAAPGRSRF